MGVMGAMETVEDDVDLLDRWCAGDRAAGNALFDRYFRLVYRFFEHKRNIDSDIDELVQDTFLGCLRSREAARRANSFRAYLFGIARHTLYHYWRKRNTRGEEVDFEQTSIASLSTSAGSRIDRRQRHARLLDALRGLPLEQQLMLELSYWEDLEREQLAEVFEIEPATTRSRQFRARQALRERLDHSADGPRLDDADFDAWTRTLRRRSDLK